METGIPFLLNTNEKAMFRSFLIFSFYLIANTLIAQRVSEVRFSQEGQKIIISYGLSGVKYYQVVNISLYASTDGGKTYQGPLRRVEGDIGQGIEPGKNRSITWEVLEEMPDFGGVVAFEVRAVVNEEKPARKTYVGYKGSYLASLGIVVGTTGKSGFYLSARANPYYFKGKNSALKTKDGLDVQGFNGPGYYEFTSSYQIDRLSITGGVSFQLSRKLRIYAGGGYAINNVLWKISQLDYNGADIGEEWVKNTQKSFSFPEVETGLWLGLHPVFISAGLSICGDKWVDGVASVGIVF
ncbi:MAG: hypothetical protein RIG77_25750 [Cyclobacteriaceae bacterium]